MLTKKDYCDYDTRIALEELGFPIRSIIVKGEEKNVPILLYEAQKWLREDKGIGITIFHNYYHDTHEIFYTIEMYNTKHWLTTFGEFEDWNVALLEGIKEAIKLLKEEK
jgi:hypothetical protein